MLRATLAVALATTLAAAQVGVGLARAEEPVILKVQAVGAERAVNIDLAQAGAPDMLDASYGMVAAPGAPTQAVTVDAGYSVAEVLSDAGIDPASFTVAEVSIEGAPAVIASQQALSSTVPGVFWQDGQGQHFADSVASDYRSGPDGGAQIALFDGALLTPAISSSTTRIAAGGSVRFTASGVGGALPGESLSYEWEDAANGPISNAQSLTQRFTIPGTYYVELLVTGSAGSIGLSAPIEVTVGRTPQGPKRAGGGTIHRRAAPQQGPGRRGSPSTRVSQPKAVDRGNGAGLTHNGSSGRGGDHGGRSQLPSGAATPAGAAPAAAGARGAAGAPPSARPPAHHHPSASAGRALVVSGIPVTIGRAAALPPEAPSLAGRQPATGAVDPARTGHLARHSHGLPATVTLGLGAVLALLVGSLLESVDRSRIAVLGGWVMRH